MISNIIQAAFCQLDTVLISFGYLVHHFTEMSGTDADDVYGSKAIIESLEKRWLKTDQDVLIAAVILNPFYQQRLYRSSSSFHNLIDITSLITRLWSRIYGGQQPPLSFSAEIREYLESRGRYSQMNMALQMEVHDSAAESTRKGVYSAPNPINVYVILGFKDANETIFSAFAKYILDISANSASCERLFSAFRTILTRLRNRMLPKNMLNIAQLAAQSHNLPSNSQQQPSLYSSSNISGLIDPSIETGDDAASTHRSKNHFWTMIELHQQNAKCDDEFNVAPAPHTTTSFDQVSSHAGPTKITLSELFNLDDPSWAQVFGQQVQAGFNEELELHTLLDTDTAGGADGDGEVDEDIDISLDETTEQALL
ncbi:hypothetical protein NP233_g3427 [Leucocoprinus birnbaumii]|uniref:HAT C-terminal dimerisation domain-containing protein n=1 Tax=Leucocoprinus birnbaumii TaxID=56174 RepID=A0AAD5VWI9_9AGAR|nr:hypothetical protein NP233_g3427 [Leucocoprinus birnbaumii]